MWTRKDVNKLRKRIKEAHPDLAFTIRQTSFSDLARDTFFFVESNAWGMAAGNHDLYLAVNAIAKEYAQETGMPVAAEW